MALFVLYAPVLHQLAGESAEVETPDLEAEDCRDDYSLWKQWTL